MSIRSVVGILFLSVVVTAAIGCARQLNVKEQTPASRSAQANASVTVEPNASPTPNSPI